jgi:hypothetical protein
MARFFISYSRVNSSRIDDLVRAVEYLGHEVWIDRELVGGRQWWDEILENIRCCDVFVAALSAQSLASKPCQLEYGYATALNKSILPVLVAADVAPEQVPADLARIQFVDYREGDEQSALALARALAALPVPKPLPNPLPPPPELLPSLQTPRDRNGTETSVSPTATVLSRPLVAMFWGAIVLVVIFPIALLAAATTMVIFGSMAGLNQAQISPGWTLALTLLFGWFVWVYLSARIKRGIDNVSIGWRKWRTGLVSRKSRLS